MGVLSALMPTPSLLRAMFNPSTALSGAASLLSGESQGLAFDFTDFSALIRDTGTPANNYDSTGIVSSGALVGPSGKLTYTSPSNKLTLQSDGYYKYQAHNLCIQSEDLSTGWTSAGTPVRTASTVQDDNGAGYEYIYQNITGVVGATYYINLRIAKDAVGGSTRFPILRLTQGAANNDFAIDTSTGAYTGSVTGSVAFSSAAVTDQTTYWDVVLSVACTNATMTLGLWPSVGTNADVSTASTANYSNTLTGTVGFSHLHVYRYPANTDYIKTTSAAKYALPIEYNTSGNCLGLLVEEARTNLCLQSADFATTWTTTECTVSANTATAPNGLTHADKLIPSTNNAAHYVNQSITFTAAPHAFSAYCKADGYDYIQIFDSVAGTAYANFNLSTGAVGNTSDYTASIASVGNGWYRVCIVFTMTASARTMRFCPINADTASRAPAFTGDGTSGVLIWGAQAELGSFPTSPIITYGAAATRAADNISIATSAFPHSATEFSVYFYGEVDGLENFNAPFAVSDGTSNNRVEVYGSSTGAFTYRVTAGGAAQVLEAISTPGSYAAGTPFKLAIAAKANDFAGVQDGGTVATDATGTMPTVTSLRIGMNANLSQLLRGRIKAIAYVPRRKSDPELQTETA